MRTLCMMMGLALVGCGPKATPVESSVTPVAVAAPPAVDSVQVASFEHAWARIGEQYFSADMGGVDWDAVRVELLPAAAKATTNAELRPVLTDMMSRLGKSHFQVLGHNALDKLPDVRPDNEVPTPGAKPGHLGMTVRYRGGVPLVVDVDQDCGAQSAGVQPGWVIHSMYGNSLAPIMEMAKKSMQSPMFYATAAVQSVSGGMAGDKVPVVFLDGAGAEQSVELHRCVLEGQPTQFGNMPTVFANLESRVIDDKIGYIAFNIFMPSVVADYNAAMASFVKKDLTGVIIDLRGNPGGLGGMVIGMSGFFVDAPKALGKMTTRDSTLTFMANPRAASQRFNGPLVVLVDEMSGSTSELFAAGLKGVGRATVIGTTSAGMALPSVFEVLPNGDRIQFAIADLVGPDGEAIEGAGVVPDIAVQVTREGLLAGNNAVMDAAVEYILKESNP